MKTVIFVILPPYADWEAAYISSALRMLNENYAVKTASLSKEPVESIGGFKTMPDYDLSSVPDDYEALILIGGYSWRTEGAKNVKPLVEKCLNNNKILGGICDAVSFLGMLGVLNDVRHTCNDLSDLKQWAGESYSGEDMHIKQQAVRGENIITANGSAALEFAKEVMLALNAAPEDKIAEWYKFHKFGLYGSQNL